MSAEAISETNFIREYTRELHNKNAAVFAGAGLSMASGYVDWRVLLKEIIWDLNLDPDKEHDLVTIAESPRFGKPADLYLLDDQLRQAD